MTSITMSLSTIKRPVTIKKRLYDSGLCKVPRRLHTSIFPHAQVKSPALLCTKSFSWEATSPYATDDNSIVKGSDVVDPIDAEEAPELSILQNEEEDVIEMKNRPDLQQQQPKWPMWFLGPSILLATGMVPTLWLPLSTVFLGPNIAGLLSLVGLDCIFNMGATLFLLMADSCARRSRTTSSSVSRSQVPLTYKLWNLGASILGFVVPLVMLFASYKGSIQPHLPFISFAVLLGPYLLLLSIQILTEMLTWHWKSPVWLLTPIVYEAYRVLQLMRGLRLGSEIAAASWAVETIRCLVSWWVLVLGIQLMRVAWFAGHDPQI